MARPREFDADLALKRAMSVFWAKGYAATSTDDLLKAMKIGRQSMYDAFGGKPRLYREALERYQQESVAGHLQRLRSGSSPLAGIEALMVGLIPADDDERRLGCMGVGSVAEFGTTDACLVELRARSGAVLFEALAERLRAAQSVGELNPALDISLAARFLQTTMQGLQLAARSGADFASLKDLAVFAVARLRPKQD
ncbi:MAG TPA: TetR family transcriptional regulator [Caulobacteraceae bacterium]|nr:TetR family transcriptional regulator [Caulobacteraceae bacterium]